MSKEWYLMNSPHSCLSGFENNDLTDFARESFMESLESNISESVEIFNSTLTDHKIIRVIIQNRLSDTKLKSLQRTVLTPINTVKAGMYIKYKERFWLVTNVVDDNGIFEKSIIILCNYLLSWINDSGDLVQRWTNIESASQYNNGESKTTYFTLRTDQILMILPCDSDCLMLTNSKRFIIDKRCELFLSNSIIFKESDTSFPVETYKITRTDSVFYNYGENSLLQFLLTQDEKKEQDGCYLIDDNLYWLCEDDINKREILSTSKIEFDTLDAYLGLEPIIFTAKFKDNTIKPKWNIVGENSNMLKIEYFENSISIFAENDKLLNKSFVLELYADGYEKDSITFNVKAFI